MTDKFCDALELVSESEQTWLMPIMTLLEEGKAAIVITAAHAETIAVAIKSNQGGEYQIQLPTAAPRARVANRFRYAKTIVAHSAATRMRRKP